MRAYHEAFAFCAVSTDSSIWIILVIMASLLVVQQSRSVVKNRAIVITHGNAHTTRIDVPMTPEEEGTGERNQETVEEP